MNIGLTAGRQQGPRVLLGLALLLGGCSSPGPLSHEGEGGAHVFEGIIVKFVYEESRGHYANSKLVRGTGGVEQDILDCPYGGTHETFIKPDGQPFSGHQGWNLDTPLNLVGNRISGKLDDASGKWCASDESIFLTDDQYAQLMRKEDDIRHAAEEAAEEARKRCEDAEAARLQRIADWRALRVKPPLSANAERNRVLAENAVQEKDFAAAARYYENGLRSDPLWPEGQFNAALLDGELQNYAGAAFHMRAYLELVPDAKDAIEANNKLIVWDEKARLAQPPGFASRNRRKGGRLDCDSLKPRK